MNFKSILLQILFIFGLVLNVGAYDNIYQIYDDGTYAQVATYDETSFTYHHLGNRDIVEGGVAVNENGVNKIVYFQYHPNKRVGLQSTNNEFYLCSWAICKIYRPNQYQSNVCT